MKKLILTVKINPNARQNAIVRWQDNILHVRIAAPPDKGKANAMLITFLAMELGVPKSAIEILSGHSSRIKKLQIIGSLAKDIRMGID